MAPRIHLGLPVAPAERRLLIALGSMNVLLWIGASAIVPLMPTYLRQRGSTPLLVGVVMASYFALSVLTQYPIGRMSDRVGHRQVMVWGLVVFALGSLGFALIPGAGAAIVFRSLQGLGAGAVTVAGAATIGTEIAAPSRGGAFAVFYGSQSLALAIGPLVGSLIGASSMRLLFSFASVLGVVAIAPVLAVVPRGAQYGRATSVDPSTGIVALGVLGELPVGKPTRKRGVVRSPGSLGAVLVFAAVGLQGGLYETCWSLLLLSRHASSLAIGLSWTLYCVPYALLSSVSGRLSDRSSRRVLVAVGLGISACFAIVYPLLSSVPWLVGLGCIEAFGGVLVTPAALSVLSESTPPSRQGAAQGAVQTARTGATALAAAGCGALYGVRTALPFVVTAIALFAVALVVVVAWQKLPVRSLDRTVRTSASY